MEAIKRNSRVDVPSGHTAQPYRHSDPGIVATENRVEELVAELSRTIRSAEPQRRSGLKELAETLLHDEVSSIAEVEPSIDSTSRRYRSNPLLGGLLLILLGLGLSLVVAPIGLTLGFIGGVLMVWGVFISWYKK
jgi:uncharacterized oligopeptide transporter (OPT) family protein